MLQINKLYIRNLDVDWDNETIWKGLACFIPIKNVTKIYKVKDYAFVHFRNKENAEQAMYALQGIIFVIS